MSTSQTNNLYNLDLEKYPLWKHVTVLRGHGDGGGNRTWRCNYCGIEKPSSYSRVSAHLLKQKNQGIVSCSKITTEIVRQLQIEVDLANAKEKKKQEAAKQKSDYLSLPSGSDLVQPKRRRGNQSTIVKAFNLKDRDDADKECARMFYSGAIPFNFVRNPHFRSFCYKLSTLNVAGYCPPSYNRLRTTLLAQECSHLNILLQPIKDGWVKRGVSVCSDGWSDGSSKPIINIMAASGTTAMFLDSVDASGIRKDATYIAGIFSDAIDEIGAEHVVQVVTDNGSNFKAAGGLVEKKHPSIFWTPCVVHCVNLAFKSICEPSENSDNYDQCHWIDLLCDEVKEISKFVSGHDMVKSLFKKYSNHQLLHVAKTRFASHYIVAERLGLVKSALDQMVIDPEWRTLFRSPPNNPNDIKAKKIRMLILDESWWEKIEYFLEFGKPIYEMIRIGDKDAPVLHLVYDMWDSMIEEVKMIIFKKEEKDIHCDSSPFFDAIQQVLESRWNKSNTPLHCLAHSLVPKYYGTKWQTEGRNIFQRVAPHQDQEVSSQRNLCFQRLFVDPQELRNVMKEYGSFSSGLDFFSLAHVLAARDDEEPISWWANYGSSAPHLQTLAFKLLSQPASSSCCERNWSHYDNILTLKRNRLTSTRAKDLVKVHNNLRLLARQSEKYKNGPSKYWDIGGDKYNVDAELLELADLSVNDPELEGVFFELGDEDGHVEEAANEA
ncbi:uncharacterized protein LOC141632583 [Silene latifolia]|uniref:uncharacterized protein LOC141632583 n=1 Tax=Silene latifolia TaxID=37657 RepID=UPI003D78624C